MAFAFGRRITVDHTKVPVNQSGFPVLIQGVFPYLKTVANGGDVQNSSGYDIVFATDNAGASQLDWEVVSYDPATGAAEFWIKANLSSVTDSVFYLLYGDASITTDQSKPGFVWNGNWEAVWHLADGTTLSALDSTPDNYDGTITGTVNAATGKINGGAEFPSSADGLIDVGDQSGIQDTVSFQTTLSFWIQSNSGPVKAQVLSKTDNSTKGFLVQLEGTKLSFIFFRATTAREWHVNVAIPANGSKNYVAITYTGHTTDGQPGLILYINGSVVAWDGYTDGSGSFTGDSGTSFQIGGSSYYAGANGRLDGILDEVRYDFATHDADYIATEYNNQSNQATFYAVGSSFVPPVPPPVVNSFFASPTSYVGAGSSTLFWNVTGAASVSISPAIGSVAASGSQVVSPTVTTLYTLTATNAGGSTLAYATVSIVGVFALLSGPVALPGLRSVAFRKIGPFSSPSNPNKKAVVCCVFDDSRVVSPAAHLAAIATTDGGTTWNEIAGPGVYCKAGSSKPTFEALPFRVGENVYILHSLTRGAYSLLKFSFASMGWVTLNASIASYLGVSDDPASIVAPDIVVNNLGYGMANIFDDGSYPGWHNESLLRFDTSGTALGIYRISEPDGGWNNGNPGFRAISQLSNPNYFVGVNTDQSFTASVVEGDGSGNFRDRTLHFASDTSSYTLSVGVPTSNSAISVSSATSVLAQLLGGSGSSNITVNMMAVDAGANQPFNRNFPITVSGATSLQVWGNAMQRGQSLFVAACNFTASPPNARIVAEERDASNSWLTQQVLATDNTGKIQNLSTAEFSNTIDMLTASSDGHSGSITDYPYYDIWFWKIQPPVLPTPPAGGSYAYVRDAARAFV